MQTEQYEIMFRAEDSHWWYRALHRLIFEALDRHLPDWRDKSILDAGCGTGAVLQRLGNSEKHRGIDLSPEAIAFCRRRGLNNAQHGDVAALPFSNASFDAVICSSVLYHEWVPDVPAALAELHRVLRPGGILLVNLPAHHFLHSPHDVAVQTARRFTRKESRNLVEGAGFQVEKNTGWTSLLFPLAVAARTLAGSQQGHDLHQQAGSRSFKNTLFSTVMDVELAILRRISLPFGVGIFLVARKP